jgi:hypothetical protein
LHLLLMFLLHFLLTSVVRESSRTRIGALDTGKMSSDLDGPTPGLSSF